MKTQDFSFWDSFDYLRYAEYVDSDILQSDYVQYGPYTINDNGILNKASKRICNFFFIVKSVENEIEESKGTKQYITLEIRHISIVDGSAKYDDPKEYRLSLQDSRNITKLSNNIDITCRIFDKRSFQDIFETMIETANQTSTYIITRTGWQENGSYAFANGVIGIESNYDRVLPKQNIVKHKLNTDVNAEVTEEQAHNAAKMIFTNMGHLENKEIFFFLYLYQLLAILSTPLRRLYESRAPRFIVVLTGDPSAGKTGICNWLMGYRAYSPTIDLSTGSTETGFFQEVSEASDCVYLADDFKMNPSHRKQVEDMVETLTRVGGNNSEKKNARGSFQMRGSILMTAEFLPPLSDSSLNRMLEWHIGSQEDNWQYLDAISNNSSTYAIHYLSLIKWIIASGTDQICENMFLAFERFKSKIQHEYPYCERRIDAYAWLLAAYEEVLCKYLDYIGLIFNESLYKPLYKYASKTLKSYQHDVLEKDVLYKLCQFIIQENFKLHKHFDSLPLENDEVGFYDADSVYFIKEKTESVVKKIGAIDIKSLERKLNDARLLIKDEKRNGHVRITHKGIEYKTYCISRKSALDFVTNREKLLNQMNEG